MLPPKQIKIYDKLIKHRRDSSMWCTQKTIIATVSMVYLKMLMFSSSRTVYQLVYHGFSGRGYHKQQSQAIASRPGRPTCRSISCFKRISAPWRLRAPSSSDLDSSKVGKGTVRIPTAETGMQVHEAPDITLHICTYMILQYTYIYTYIYITCIYIYIHTLVYSFRYHR